MACALYAVECDSKWPYCGEWTFLLVLVIPLWTCFHGALDWILETLNDQLRRVFADFDLPLYRHQGNTLLWDLLRRLTHQLNAAKSCQWYFQCHPHPLKQNYPLESPACCLRVAKVDLRSKASHTYQSHTEQLKLVVLVKLAQAIDWQMKVTLLLHWCLCCFKMTFQQYSFFYKLVWLGKHDWSFDLYCSIWVLNQVLTHHQRQSLSYSFFQTDQSLWRIEVFHQAEISLLQRFEADYQTQLKAKQLMMLLTLCCCFLQMRDRLMGKCKREQQYRWQMSSAMNPRD